MNELRKGLPPLPDRFKDLPISDKGYPVPAFVEWIDGKPDFRVMRGDFRVKCVKLNLCWLCGQPLGRWKVFTIGPMCGVNRVTSEPPSHHDCALFAVKACPFLSLPKAQYRKANMPADSRGPGGITLSRNPGVTLLWTTHSYQPFNVTGAVPGSTRGWLIHLGEPAETLWFAEGREATRTEIMESIDSGMPFLAEMAQKQSPQSVRELREQYERALTLVPA